MPAPLPARSTMTQQPAKPLDLDPGSIRMKQPWLAILLSIVFTGLGQLYNGQILKGLLFMVIHIGNFVLMHWFVGIITAPVFWVYGLIDALDTAERINAQRRKAMVDARHGPAGGEKTSPQTLSDGGQ